MSDNLRRYRAIREALTQCYPGEISGRMDQHLTTLAALISGIVGSKSSQLPHIAAKMDVSHLLHTLYLIDSRTFIYKFGNV